MELLMKKDGIMMKKSSHTWEKKKLVIVIIYKYGRVKDGKMFKKLLDIKQKKLSIEYELLNMQSLMLLKTIVY